MTTEHIQTITETKYSWNLNYFSLGEQKCDHFTLSPNKRWLMLELKYSQDPEDRYESVIRDEEFILFDLFADKDTQEIGRFRYYYNYNSCADYEQESGSRYQWADAPAILLLHQKKVNLDQTEATQIIKILQEFY